MIYELEHGLGVGGGRGRPKGSRNGFISPGAAYMKNYQIRGEKAFALPDAPATSVQRGRAIVDRQVGQSVERGNRLKPKGYGLGDLALDYLNAKLPVRQAMRVNDRASQFMQENNMDAGEIAGRAADRLDPAKLIGGLVRGIRGIFVNEPEPESEDKTGEVIGSIVEELFSADAASAAKKGASLEKQVMQQSGSSRKRNFGEGTASIGNIGDVVEGRAANYNLDKMSQKGYGFGDFMMDILGTIVPVRSASNTASNVSDFFRTANYNERYPIADLNQLPEYYDVTPLVLNAANNLFTRALGPEEQKRRTYRSDVNSAHYTR